MALSSTDHEARGFRASSPGLRLVLIALLSLGLMVLDQRSQYLDETRRLLGAAVYPLQAAMDLPFATASSLRENMALRSELLARNRELNESLLLQSARLQRMAALEAENARLRGLLDSTAQLPDRVLIAEILSVDMDPLRHRVILNRGSRAGAHVGQALIDAQGVVGQITHDNILAAEALLITDPDHAVPVEVVRNGLRTIAMGTGEIDRLALPFLPRNADIEPGDLLVTSGLGGSFPAGYPVAVIRSVEDSPGDAFRSVHAEPTAMLNRIREVLLVFEDSAPEDIPPLIEEEAAAPVDERADPATGSAMDTEDAAESGE